MRKFGIWATLVLAAVALSVAAGPAAAQQKEQKKEQKKLVGESTCVECHDTFTGLMKDSVHRTVSERLKDGSKAVGCETCHGPGSVHVNDPTVKGSIFAFSKDEPVAERVAACLNCHNQLFPNLNFRRSEHIRRGVACDQCHVPSGGSEAFHKMQTVGDVMDGRQPELCYQCHTEERAGFSLPYHHPVDEKYMECTSCHTPHGSYRLTQLKSRNTEEVCTKCHEDLSGPFIFEHPVRRAGGCVACHQPHGSTNPRMLIRARTQFLCLECHANTPTFHDLSQAEFQQCTVCHSRIHGSNLSRHFFE